MPAVLNGAIRAALQALWAWLVAVAAARGFHLPTHVPLWLDAAATAAVLGVVVGAIQWAERRSDATLFGRGLRRLAAWAMLGLTPPAYPKPALR